MTGGTREHTDTSWSVVSSGGQPVVVEIRDADSAHDIAARFRGRRVIRTDVRRTWISDAEAPLTLTPGTIVEVVVTRRTHEPTRRAR